MKIMLVDDSVTMRSIQRLILTKMGHTQIVEAAHGVEALARLETFEPDLILTDWSMPLMDGLQFVAELRVRGHKTPIIMVSTESSRDRITEAVEAGVDCYVVKPFTPDLLAQRIEETLAKRAA